MIRYTKIPHSVRLTLTNRCNLHCSFCLNDSTNEQANEELRTEEWLAFIERLKELRVFNISLSGGEIFIRKDLLVLLTRLRENRMHRITLLTNGTLITGEIAAQLNQLKIKNISISLDGLEESHDQIRGLGAFRKTVAGIRHLIAGGIKPQISFTPTRSNYKDLGPLIDLIDALGLSALHVNTLTPEGRCVNIYQDIVLEFPGQVKEVLDVVNEKKKDHPGMEIACQMGFYYYLPQSYEYFQKNPQNFEMKHLKDGCGAAATSCVISATGDVLPCEGLADFAGGNIRKQDLLDIWNDSENFQKIRELGKLSMDQVPACKDCRYIFLCDGGCRATAYLIYKDLLAPCIACPYWKGDQPEGETQEGQDRRLK